MQPYEWSHFLGLSNVVVALVAVIVALLSPRIAWQLARKSQQEEQKRSTRIGVFGSLMQNRHIPQSKEAVSALNLIDVAFHDCAEVRKLWREYHGMLSNNAFFQSAIGSEMTKAKLAELQAEMAKVLSFSIDHFDIERIYIPNWLNEEEELRIRERQNRLVALRNLQPPTSVPQNSATSIPASKDQSEANENISAAIYLVHFTGVPGSEGYGAAFIGNGLIMGSDISGGRYEGSYTVSHGRLRGSVTFQSIAGSTLVTGLTSASPINLPVEIDLPIDFGNGQPQVIQVGGQPVTLTFEKMRNI